MHRLTLVAIGLVVLTTAGIAVAKGLDNAKTVTSVSGTFDAATVQHRGKARTCTTTDGTTLVTTNARYTGTAAGDGALAGGITIDARSTIDTTDNLGVVEGKLRIDVTSGADTTARFTAVYAAGKLVGLATGHVQGPHAKLFANLSSGFAAETGFSGGKLGGADGGSAVALGPGKCAPKHDKATAPKRPGPHDHGDKKGKDD
ncbi:MAG TPA: hypothetical protein VJ247_06440 [Gaiella sp.]|jgi:hypothetical protein|nr:hypothetical protein [Gaiella sp.]